MKGLTTKTKSEPEDFQIYKLLTNQVADLYNFYMIVIDGQSAGVYFSGGFYIDKSSKKE
jgi:hypothetical protein